MRQKGGASPSTGGAEPHVPSVVQKEDGTQEQRAVFFSGGTDRRLTEGYTQIPNAILRATGISAGAKMLYGLLLSYAWQAAVCWPNQATLSSDAGCSVRNVQRWLAELEDAAFIKIHQQGLNRPNLYEILPIPTAPGAAVPDTTNLSHPDTTDSSRLEATRLSHKEDSPEEDSKDNNAGACEGGAMLPVVVSSAPPPGPGHDTAEGGRPSGEPPEEEPGEDLRGGKDVHESGASLGDAPELLSELLDRVPDLPPAAAEMLIRTHGAAAVRERLLWLEAEQAALAAAHKPAIASAGGWLRRSFAWVRGPASYRKIQQQTERGRRRAEIEEEAERAHAAREAQLAESAARLRTVTDWFLGLPEDRQCSIDAQIRSELGSMLALQATGIPPLPEVLTGSGLAATLWRDRLALCFAEAAAAAQETSHAQIGGAAPGTPRL